MLISPHKYATEFGWVVVVVFSFDGKTEAQRSYVDPSKVIEEIGFKTGISRHLNRFSWVPASQFFPGKRRETKNNLLKTIH